MPPAHPARGMWDTLYLKLGAARDGAAADPHLAGADPADGDPAAADLRGHAREVLPEDRPRRLPHPPVFHQIEGLVVDEGITFGDMAGHHRVLHHLLLFGPEIHSRAALPALPVHPAVRRVRGHVPHMRGRGLPHVQRVGLDRARGAAGWSTPTCSEAVGIHPETLQRLRLRLRHRPPGPGPGPALRHAHPARQRRPVPDRVLGPAMRRPLSGSVTTCAARPAVERAHRPILSELGLGASNGAGAPSAPGSTTSW